MKNSSADIIRIPSEKMLIRTDRLSIVQMGHVHYDLIGWLNDREHMKWSEQRYIEHDSETQWLYINNSNVIRPESDNVRLAWMIRHKGDGTLIGSIAADISVRHRRADLGMLIGPPHVRQGYGKEAWIAVMHWLAKNDMIEIDTIEAGCVAEATAQRDQRGRVNGNIGMQTIMRQTMFKQGTRPNHFRIDDVSHDLVMYATGKLNALKLREL